MSKKIKKYLKELYTAPVPLEKEKFLKKLALEIADRELDGNSYGTFFQSQIRYMQKYNVVISLGLFWLTLARAGRMDPDILWTISAFVPFLALSAVLEGKRSVRYGMEELELASRFSLKFIIMARLIILGAGDMLLLGGILPVILMMGKEKVLYAGFYMLVPYLLTAFLSLYLTRKTRGKEAFYLCFFAAVLVSMGFVILRNSYMQFYELPCYWKWAAAGIVFLVLTGRECITLLKESEEYSWN